LYTLMLPRPDSASFTTVSELLRLHRATEHCPNTCMMVACAAPEHLLSLLAQMAYLRLTLA
jgi:hypothetical protein